ncbi:MAG TPA: hypothetical protein VGQ08_18805 [Nitrospiraceae bacterium]|nr:hypothetical protein [Nitrospiraceae bacterium]
MLLIVGLIYGAYIHARIVQEPVILEIVSGPRGRTTLDSLEVLTKWLNVMSKVADAVQLDLGVRKE